ncbi:MAG: metallophosphoesterase [Desulfovibrionaceae bacterium]
MSGHEAYWIGFGDIHNSVDNVRRIPDLGAASGVILSGDLTNRGGAAEARRILDAVRAHNPAVFAQIGNMDTAAAQAFLEAEGVNIHARTTQLAPGVGMVAVGHSTPTPFGTPSEVQDRQLELWLEEALYQARAYDTLLLVAHTPPYGTAADLLPMGQHVGSQAVRDFIEAVQPDVCLTGHIHEARCVERLGKTTIINPGMLAQGGYAVIRLTSDGLAGELHTL